MSLAGQTAVVTGGTRGLGAAMTRAFLAAGAAVHATYHSNDEAASAFAASVEGSGRLVLHRFDVADHEVDVAQTTRPEKCPRVPIPRYRCVGVHSPVPFRKFPTTRPRRLPFSSPRCTGSAGRLCVEVSVARLASPYGGYPERVLICRWLRCFFARLPKRPWQKQSVQRHLYRPLALACQRSARYGLS